MCQPRIPGNGTILLLLEQTRAISELDQMTPLVVFWRAPPPSTSPAHNLWYNIHGRKGEQVKLLSKASCCYRGSCWGSPASSSALACNRAPLPKPQHHTLNHTKKYPVFWHFCFSILTEADSFTRNFEFSSRPHTNWKRKEKKNSRNVSSEKCNIQKEDGKLLCLSVAISPVWHAGI